MAENFVGKFADAPTKGIEEVRAVLDQLAAEMGEAFIERLKKSMKKKDEENKPKPTNLIFVTNSNINNVNNTKNIIILNGGYGNGGGPNPGPNPGPNLGPNPGPNPGPNLGPNPGPNLGPGPNPGGNGGVEVPDEVIVDGEVLDVRTVTGYELSAGPALATDGDASDASDVEDPTDPSDRATAAEAEAGPSSTAVKSTKTPGITAVAEKPEKAVSVSGDGNTENASDKNGKVGPEKADRLLGQLDGGTSAEQLEPPSTLAVGAGSGRENSVFPAPRVSVDQASKVEVSPKVEPWRAEAPGPANKNIQDGAVKMDRRASELVLTGASPVVAGRGAEQLSGIAKGLGFSRLRETGIQLAKHVEK